MSSKAYTAAASAASKKPYKAPTTQSAPIPGREADMAKNHSGAFTFVLDDWGVLDRFIMLGTESGGYTTGVKEATKSAFDFLKKLVKADGIRAVKRAEEYSVSGRAPKNDPALVVLAHAACFGSEAVQNAAYEALPKVARTGTHLFTFVSMLNSMGKWNAAAKRGVSKWYNNRDDERLAVQMLKYQSRDGWSHRDVLRLAHTKPANEVKNNLFKYVVKGADSMTQGDVIPQLVIDFEYLKMAESTKDVLAIIARNSNVTWEMIPTKFHRDVDVMMALLPTMGLTATIRQLGRLSSMGVLANLSEGSKIVKNKLADAAALKAQRVHPITILQALKQYSAGHGERGGLSWTPVQSVVSALDDAFYLAFGSIEKTGNQLIGVDISASMTWDSSRVNGSPNLVARDVAGCMAMVAARCSDDYFIGGFSSNFRELKITPNMRLDTVLKVMSGLPASSTNCSLPMEFATQNNMKGVDLFMVITDNETNSYYSKQPSHALVNYRKKCNPLAKLAVMATSVSSFTIADPRDAGMLDIAGFDSAVPQILADFMKQGRKD